MALTEYSYGEHIYQGLLVLTAKYYHWIWTEIPLEGEQWQKGIIHLLLLSHTDTWLVSKKQKAGLR